MSEPEKTTEQMLSELAEAGKDVPKTASEEDIQLLYMELEAENEAKAPPAPEPEPKKSAKKQTLDEFIESTGTKIGDKDPEVIKWAKENLTKAEFAKRYDGRTIPRV